VTGRGSRGSGGDPSFRGVFTVEFSGRVPGEPAKPTKKPRAPHVPLRAAMSRSKGVHSQNALTRPVESADVSITPTPGRPPGGPGGRPRYVPTRRKSSCARTWGRAGSGPTPRASGTYRESYEANVGPIPAGFFVCHRCDYPPCWRPSHLFLGTPKDNLMDASRKGRLKGRRGTPWAGGRPRKHADVRAKNRAAARALRERRRGGVIG